MVALLQDAQISWPAVLVVLALMIQGYWCRPILRIHNMVLPQLGGVSMTLQLRTTAIQHMSEMELLREADLRQTRQTKARRSHLRLRGVDREVIIKVVRQVVLGRLAVQEETLVHTIAHSMVLTISQAIQAVVLETLIPMVGPTWLSMVQST